MHTGRSALLFAVVLVAAACGGPGTATPATTPGGAEPTASAAATGGEPTGGADAWPDELVFGFVPSREAEALVETVKPLTEDLTQRLTEQAGRDITVEGIVSQDYTGLVTAMEAGQAQIGAFGPFSLLQARDRAGAEIILQSVRFGSPTYHAQWFTNAPDTYCTDEPEADEDGWLNCNGTLDAEQGPAGEEALANIEPGTPVAFVEESSTSGYIFPAVQLIEAGIENPAEDLEAIFANGHDNAVLTVYNGDAEVGVSFDDARGVAFEDGPPDDPEKLVVFAYSPEIPNDGFAVAGDLPQDLKDAIEQALLDYAESEEGQETLNAIYEIDGLVEADAEAFTVVEEAAEALGITGD